MRFLYPLRRISSWFLLFLIGTIAGCGGGGSESSVYPTKYVANHSYEHCLHTEYEKICNLVNAVKNSISYGQDSAGAATTIPEIIAFGSGDCGEYALILAAELSELGIPWRRYDIKSRNSAIHAFVEIFYAGKRIVVDPTLGIIYHSEFLAMLRNPEYSAVFDGAVDGIFSAYAGPDFFKRIDFFIALEEPLGPERSSSSNVTLDSSGMYVFDPKDDDVGGYVRVYGDRYLTIARSDGLAPIRFSPYDLSFGVSLPVYERFSFEVKDDSGMVFSFDPGAVDVYASL